MRAWTEKEGQVMANNEKLSKLYDEWWSNRTPEEYKLQGLCFDYENEYFEDMLLKDGSLLNDIIETVLEIKDGIFLGIDKLRLYVVDNDDFDGCFYRNENKIEINEKHATDKSVILHELIHYYENQLEEQFEPFIRELLVLELYNKLLPTIKDLRERIFKHCELYSYTVTFKENGSHGVLFFLKSLDLDIRCGYPLGTICGYGRDK